jgi:hypothetical protein
LSHKSWPAIPHGGLVRLGPCASCGGKWTYPDRKAARAAARHLHPGDPGLAAYRCPLDAGYWHIGHSSPEMRDMHRRTA